MTFDPSPETPPAGGLPLSDPVLPDLGEAPLDEAPAPPAESDESIGGESPMTEPPALTNPPVALESPAADSAGAVPPSPADAARDNARNGIWDVRMQSKDCLQYWSD